MVSREAAALEAAVFEAAVSQMLAELEDYFEHRARHVPFRLDPECPECVTPETRELLARFLEGRAPRTPPTVRFSLPPDTGTRNKQQ